jgi:cardiolipin synthase
MWEGAPAPGPPEWRDTGVEVRGPAVAEVARAFADTWAATGAPLPPDDVAADGLAAAGDLDLRVVASTLGTAGLYRLDVLVASLARRTLWLTDAYFAGTSSYVQALRAAAEDGVDVRLLVPGPGSDVPVMRAVSRAGYRALLEAGIRVFEWNGSMLHAKTAVADARWARVGSTNLNLASWMGNRELDVVVENAGFGRGMEEMFLDDLGNSTEIVLQRWARVRPAQDVRRPRLRGAGGSTTRAAAGALRVGNALGSVLAARRLHGPAERWLMAQGGLLLAVLATGGFLWPRLLAWPLAGFGLWLGLALLLRAARRRAASPPTRPRAAGSPPPRPEPRGQPSPEAHPSLAPDQDQNASRNGQDVQEYAQGGDQGHVAHEAHQDQPDSQEQHAEILREPDSHSDLLREAAARGRAVRG